MEILEPYGRGKLGISGLGTSRLPSASEKAWWKGLHAEGRFDSPNARAGLKGVLTNKVKDW